MGPAHRVAALFDVAQDLVENGICAAMGGDDFELAAPGGDWFGHPIEEALVGVQRKFVEDDVAAFARECVWVVTEGVNASAILEAEDVTGETVFLVEEDFAQIGGNNLEGCGPVSAVFQENRFTGYVLRFQKGRCIYSLSSNPN